MHVIVHDHPGVQEIANTVEMPQAFGNDRALLGRQWRCAPRDTPRHEVGSMWVAQARSAVAASNGIDQGVLPRAADRGRGHGGPLVPGPDLTRTGRAMIARQFIGPG